jgi:hypothetical protein
VFDRTTAIAFVGFLYNREVVRIVNEETGDYLTYREVLTLAEDFIGYTSTPLGESYEAKSPHLYRQAYKDSIKTDE